jgi:hypothetical protein
VRSSPESASQYPQRHATAKRGVLGACGAALLLAVATIATIVWISKGIELANQNAQYQRFPLASTVEFTLSEPGDYAVYHEPTAYNDDNPIWLLTLARKLTDPDGAEVSLLRPTSHNVSCWNDNCSIQVAVFHANKPGQYHLETDSKTVAEAYPSDELAIGKDQAELLFWSIGGGFVAIASIIIGMFLLIRRLGSRR